MPSSAPAYTFGGITRPALIFDNAGNIILTPEAAAFAAAYGTKALYAGLPANTPFPPVAATLSTPADSNGGVNSVLENAAVGTQVGITVQATNLGGPPVTYSLTDNAGGRFQINATTGVVTVAAALDYETAPGHAYNVTVQATDGILTSSQTFAIGVGNVNEAPAGTNGTVTASEDTNRVFTSADFGFSDSSDSPANALAAVRIATLPATGTLLNNGVPVVAGDSVSAAAIAAGHLVFVPAANASGAGYASFTFQVRDNGGTANGGVDLDQSPNTITINVTAVNDAPTATGLTQSLVINEDAAPTQLFSAVVLPVTDIDSANVTATLTLVNPAAGVLTGGGFTATANPGEYTFTGTPVQVTAALNAVQFDSTNDFNGSTSVNVAISDGANGPQGVNPTGTISITVNAVNDAPAGANNTITTNEDTNRVFTSADFGFSDSSDNPANALAAVVITTLPAAGTLLNNGNPVAAGDSVSAAAIAAGQLVFVPAANANGAGYASFTFQVRDTGGNANGGVDTDATANTITVNVNAVNDAPTATGLTQSLVINEDAAATQLFSAVVLPVADVDSANVTATLTLVNPAAGVLTGGGFTATATPGEYTFTGTPVQVTAALNAVQFDSTDDFNGSTSVNVAISDGANGPQGTNPTGTVSITVNAVNDAPTATNLTQPLTINEDDAATTLFTVPPVVSDIDSATVSATLTLGSAAHGVLTGAGVGTPLAGALVYTISGTPAQVNAALAAVKFDSAPDFNGSTDVIVAIDDGSVGPGGNINILVNAVNDAPTATNLTQSLTIGEDDAATTLFTLSPVVSDIDSANVTATLTLDAGAGVLTGAGAGVLNASVLTYTITGTPAAVSAALAGVAFDSAPDFNGITDVGITVSDGANGPQGSNPIGTGTVTINAVNDAPTATNLTQSLSVGEDGAAATLFTLAPVVADVDSSNVTATLTLNASAGVLNGAGAGVLNAGVLSYTITGTAAAVNAALAAVAYDSADNFSGAASVGVTVDDGASGPQGANPTGTISITVNAVNDAPTATNLTQSIVINEDAAATTLFTLPPVTADIDSASVTATLKLDAAAGVLNGAGAGVLNLGVLTYTITGTPAAVNAALAAVTYDSAPDFNGTTSVGVTIDDGVNGPQGSNPTGSIGITVNSVNDAPTVTATANNPTYVPGADLFSGVTASTVESGQTITQVVLTVSNVLGNDETLSIDGNTVALIDGTVSGAPTATLGVSYSVAMSGNTATITITSPGLSGAQTGTLVDGLSYTNATVGPGELPRVVTIVSLTDNGGNLLGGSDTGTPGIASTVNFNAPPVANDDAASATEAGGLNNTVAGTNPSGNVITAVGPGDVADTDADPGDTVTVVAAGTGSESAPTGVGTVNAAFNGLYGSLLINTDGSYTYTVNQSNAAVQALLPADTITDTFNYTIQDNGGAQDKATLTFTIHGANDLPQAVADTGSITEDAAPTVFAVLVNNDTLDPDAGALNTIAITGTVTASSAGDPLITNGDATATVIGSQIQITLGADFQTLAVGETATVTVPYTLTGNAGETSSTSLTVTVTGVNDGVTANDDNGGTITEEAGATTFNVRGNDVLDVDHTAPNSISINSVNATDAGGDGITGADVTASVVGNQIQFTLGSDFQKLGGNESSTITINYSLQGDQPGDTDSATLTYTVNGVNDAPVAQDFTFNAASSGIANTSLVLDNGSGGAPVDPAGPQKTVSGSLLTGATDIDTASSSFTVTAETVSNAAGSITYTSDGDFTFMPTAGFTGNAVFNYTLNDNAASGNASDVGQITINVATPKVWYVDASAAAGGDGTSDNPFNSFTQLNGVTGDGSTNDDVDGPNDIIFVYGGTYTGGIVLEDGQILVSQSQGLTVNSTSLVSASGGNATINGAVVLANNNNIDGINFGNSGSASVYALSGTNVGNAVITDSSINNTSGGGVSIDGSTASMNLQFTSISSSGGASGISLTNTQGTFNAAGGTLSGHTTSELSISGGTSNITYGGAIADGTGLSATIVNRTGGTVTVSGNINNSSDTGGGIGISGNANTTINFTGSAKVLNTGIGDGVSMTNNTGTSNVNFTNGGLDIDTSNGTGFQATVAGTYTVTGSGNSITTNGNGSALNLDTIVVGAGGITFNSTSSTNSTGTAVAIDSVTGGAIALGGGSISGSDGDAFRVGDGAGTANTGGTSAITYGGAISKTDGSGQAVDIQDRAAGAGNITLSGNITHNVAANTGILLDDNAAGTITFSGSSKAITSTTATAVNLTDNAGATIAFTNGGLAITTTAGNGFNATGPGAAATSGGTVTVEGSGNTITSTTGIALNVVNTTIGANDLTFQSISANGGANGIVLNNTGSSGGLHVTGNGTTVGASGGGVIQNMDGADGAVAGNGIYLNNTRDVELNGLQLNGFENSAIRGLSVNGFTLTNSTISGTSGDSTGAIEGAIAFGDVLGVGTAGLTGNSLIDNVNISGSIEHHIEVYNQTGTMNLTIRNSNIHDNSVAGGSDGIQMEIRGNAASTVNIANNSFSNNKSQAIQLTALEDSNLQATISGNTITRGTQGNEGIVIANGGNADARVLIGGPTAAQGNTISGFGGVAIFVGQVAGQGTNQSLLEATIQHNTVTSPASATNHAILAFVSSQTGQVSQSRFLIDSNTVNYNSAAARAILVDAPDSSRTPEFYATVTNNTVNSTDASALTMISVAARNGAVGHSDVRGNDVNFAVGVVAAGINVREASGGSNVLARGGSASNDAAIVLAANNPSSTTAVLPTSGDIPVVENATILLPTTPTLPALPLLAAAGGVASASGTPGEAHLSQAQLDSVISAAIAQWAQAGATSTQLAKLAAMTFTVANLSGDAVGEHSAGHVTIDTDAAGHGWFVDSTPSDSFEFAHAANAAGTDLFTVPSSAAAGHIDLLTAVVHEMGHELGLAHSDEAGDVMSDTLVDGERRLPDAADVALANPGHAAAQASLMPVVRGTSGNDTIHAGFGGNILVGLGGADNFVFANAGATPPQLITHVADYRFAEGDTFDFSALTSAFHGSAMDDAFVVRAVEDAGGAFATLQVNTANLAWGTKLGPTWTDVAQIDGAQAGDDVSVLIDSHGAVHLAHLHVGLLA